MGPSEYKLIIYLLLAVIFILILDRKWLATKYKKALSDLTRYKIQENRSQQIKEMRNRVRCKTFD